MAKNISKVVYVTDVNLRVANIRFKNVEDVEITIPGKYNADEKILEKVKPYLKSDVKAIHVVSYTTKKAKFTMSLKDFITNSERKEME